MFDLTQSELAILLLRSFLYGAALGLIYEVVRAVKMLLGVPYGNEKNGESGRGGALLFVFTFITDLIFWTGAGCTAIILAYSGGGFYRGMILLGMGGGFLVYRVTLGRLLLSINLTLTAALKRLAIKMMPLLLKPLRIIFRWIISLYHLTMGRIIDKIIEDRKNKARTSVDAESDALLDGDDGRKEDFVYVEGNKGYRRDGRVSFGRRDR